MILAHINLQNPTLGQEITFLSSGISDASILSVYSTSIEGSFITARTFADTTAILFKEPDILPTRRQSDNQTQTQRACKKTVIPLGKVKKKFDPLLTTLSKLTKPISDKKSELLRNAGLSCLYPKLLRPFQPILDKVSCIVGLDEEEENQFVKTEKCNFGVLATPPYTCSEPSLETKPIQQGLKLRPDMEDIEQEDMVRTLDDCFPGEMTKATYGARVHVVLVQDESCEDELYADICKEQENLNRILFEEDCLSPGYDYALCNTTSNIKCTETNIPLIQKLLFSSHSAVSTR